MPVLLESRGHVAVITLDNSSTRNALDGELARELLDRLEEVAADQDCAALVVRGAHGTFCSGADRQLIAQARSATPPASGDAQFKMIYSVFARLADMPIPTIAAVRGAAVGAGANLALATDIRIVSEDTRLIAGFLRIGIHPGGGHLLMSHRAAGREATVAMSILGQEVSGRRLVELGLAWAAVPDEEVEPTALRLAAATDPELVRRTTATFRAEVMEPAMTISEAASLEQPAQFWSFRRGMGPTENERR